MNVEIIKYSKSTLGKLTIYVMWSDAKSNASNKFRHQAIRLLDLVTDLKGKPWFRTAQ